MYDTYKKLFGDTCDLMKYVLSLTKPSQRGFDLGTDSDREDEGNKLPINLKTTDSSDSPIEDKANSSMNIFDKRSGDKRNCKQRKEKAKKTI